MTADILKRLRPKEALVLIKSVGLRKKYEDVLILNYVEDLTYEEISKRIHLTPESVGNLVHKARKQFEKYT